MKVSFASLAQAVGRSPLTVDRPIVCIQGLGFVGAAMAIAVAAAKRSDGSPCYNVIGIDLPNSVGLRRVDTLNHGLFPFETTDKKLNVVLQQVYKTGNLIATTDTAAYSLAKVTVVDVPLDIDWDKQPPSLRLEGFKGAIRQLGQSMCPDSLILVETTVPPGTTARIVVPLIEETLQARNLSPNAIHVAHSYERVMPGKDYFDSIVNYWRVYAGHTEAAAHACQKFLTSIINTVQYPLTRLSNTNASEFGKVLENTYRATTIALMEEWGRFAELVDVDLFEVVNAIRKRPTHNNMRTPGFGVGGYCLTKDPLFGALAAREIFQMNLKFPFSTQAVEINRQMPLVSLRRIEQRIGGLQDKTVLLLGISYRQDVGDTRYAPAELFFRTARERGARVIAHDPLVHYWKEMDLYVSTDIPSPVGVDAILLAVPHQHYRELDYRTWLDGHTPLIFDGFDVLSKEQRHLLRELGCKVESIGRGEQL